MKIAGFLGHFVIMTSHYVNLYYAIMHSLRNLLLTGATKTKVLPEPQGPISAALISVSVALSQTPAEAASPRPQTRG